MRGDISLLRVSRFMLFLSLCLRLAHALVLISVHYRPLANNAACHDTYMCTHLL